MILSQTKNFHHHLRQTPPTKNMKALDLIQNRSRSFDNENILNIRTLYTNNFCTEPTGRFAKRNPHHTQKRKKSYSRGINQSGTTNIQKVMCKKRAAQYGCKHILTGRVHECPTARGEDRLCKKLELEMCQVRQKCPRCKAGMGPPPRRADSADSSSLNATDTGSTSNTRDV
jgi:hypothetical protein